MNTPLRATDPGTSASVVASAGTGKTWLLVTRMLRLLVAGAEPGGLLAVTFTNRAAGEMRARLMERARALATCADDALTDMLAAMDIPDDDAARHAARCLFERLLATPWPPRVMTFHAFCQDLLSRFPLEAGVAPGFELLATERELHDAAWDALVDECGRSADDDATVALERLAAESGSLDAARGWLRGFIAHRADWWAWTAGSAEPLAHALDTVGAACGYTGTEPGEWLTGAMRTRIQRFCTLVGSAPHKSVVPPLDAVTALLADSGAAPETLCAALDGMLHTAQGGPRKALVKKGIAAIHGADAAAEVERLQRELIETSANWQLARLNRAWLIVGERLLAHYQRLKADARVLDFADLEWLACRLLNQAEQSEWIQYRLDQRIDHVLVDEFQDTNPTQWRLLQPLLAEVAAGDAGRARSAFIVGDAKQSIYAFRRADARLLDAAAGFLHERLGAPRVPLEGSRRSATAVMDFVNAVFTTGALPLPDFTPHATHLPALHGRVEWLQVPGDDGAASAGPAPDALRNPLRAPRKPDEELRGLAEARAVADRIRALYDAGTPIADGDVARPIGWDDVMVLVRTRTRIAALEQALRERHIPYASDNRGMLLDRPEILDMLALLEHLVAPWNNVQLARLLKSPLFGCSDADLLSLAPADPDAQRRPAWHARLHALADGSGSPALSRAARCLARWRERADRVPVHDLLDAVFADGDVLARYQASSPPHLRAAVSANLVQFLDLALDADAGRYPTLHRLVEKLERTREAAAREREFDDAPVAAADGRVRVMTVHSAKGLEAPVVFVAQVDLEPRADGMRTWVDWPTAAPAPRWMMLARGSSSDTATDAVRAADAARAAGEEANLLYVALTRARQYLFVSGQPGGAGWYPALEQVFAAREWQPFESGTVQSVQAFAPIAAPTPDAALGQRIQAAPERPAPTEVIDPAAVEHGILVHAALETSGMDREYRAAALAAISGRPAGDSEIGKAIAAADRVRTAPELAWLFDPERYVHAWDEARLACADGGSERHGVVDRLVVTDDEVWVIDYKTHPDPEPRLAWLRERHGPQLARYRDLAQALWPQHTVRTALLFTALPRLEVVD